MQSHGKSIVLKDNPRTTAGSRPKEQAVCAEQEVRRASVRGHGLEKDERHEIENCMEICIRRYFGEQPQKLRQSNVQRK